ncbi:hypothetical protein CONCODRAFT_78294 [Conidiobolus coronatus NRRL 28638]|uniref:Late embryogenesis abundant protein LEA-2 subgroup domain-containing protein n=1 Tax=Conidiobolus coronatus (strain ATCC 28846 / CBS 209.66 / NRRL 28638) TaxID=796925 RepID=A0A137P951_CONC2|nr:hypothetical protein CONCODRAFT_78294 [Conidiobolus coronatus NRRL 28638]|eukprot:KXN71538.1 hypothetical protein CONCODRAFT_78294 [Conidiobolus coronatus NRRL 28638]
MTGRSPFDRSPAFQSIRDEDPDFGIPKKTRKRCTCCYMPFWTCLIAIAFILGGIGTCAFFLWPRMPQVSFIDSGKPDKSTSIINKESAVVQFPVHLSFYNPNYIPINVQNLDMDLYLRPDDAGSLKAGNGWIESPMKFPARTTTNFSVQTKIFANFTDRGDKNVKGLTYLLNGCLNNQKIKVDYNAKADVPSISFLGLRPQFSGSIDIDCPFDTSQLKASVNPSSH